MTTKLRVLLVDDHNLVRSGIRSLLEDIEGIEVVGEAADGGRAIELALELRPDLAVMDIAMKGVTGLEAAARIRRDVPETRVLILSMYANEEYVLAALKAGASGYLLKDAATAELALAVEAVRQGQAYLSPGVSVKLVEAYAGRAGEGAHGLTPRQEEILRLISEGNATKEIAHRLGLSVKTVESHRAQIMDRLGIRDVAGLVRYAIRTGLIRPDP
jgi:DNA-binding NarL/FixJ family response regulator